MVQGSEHTFPVVVLQYMSRTSSGESGASRGRGLPRKVTLACVVSR